MYLFLCSVICITIKSQNINVSIPDMMVNPTSLTVGDRAQIKESLISKNSDNPAYYDTINEEL
jgi:hypothetical protein